MNTKREGRAIKVEKEILLPKGISHLPEGAIYKNYEINKILHARWLDESHLP